MKKKYLVFHFFLISFAIFGQKNSEIGIFAGASYYMGDVNPDRHFYASRPSFGAFYKYNVNEFLNMRMGFTYGLLHGNDLDFNNNLQLSRGHSFEAVFIDLGLQAEFNFLPFKVTRLKKAATPYVTTGIAYTFFLGEAATFNGYPTIPFGVGAKVGWSKRITTAIEWSFRKTFIDKIDGLESPGQSINRSFIHNNDWLFLSVISIIYKFQEPKGDCPVYWK